MKTLDYRVGDKIHDGAFTLSITKVAKTFVVATNGRNQVRYSRDVLRDGIVKRNLSVEWMFAYGK